MKKKSLQEQCAYRKATRNRLHWATEAKLKREREQDKRNNAIKLSELQETAVQTSFDYKKLKDLMLYKGRVPFGRVQALFNFSQMMMKGGCENVIDARYMAYKMHTETHLCGLHGVPNNNTIERYFVRLADNTKVTNGIKGLTEYAEYFLQNSRNDFKLERISDKTGESRLAKHIWWREYRPELRKSYYKPITPKDPFKGAYKSEDLKYPFTNPGQVETDSLLEIVHKLVPKGLPQQVRGDVCQDLIVSILAGEVELENLKDAIKPHITKVFRMFPVKYGHLSLDQNYYGQDRSLGELIDTHGDMVLNQY